MKKLILSTILFAAFILNIKAQGIHLGLKLGANLNKIEGTELEYIYQKSKFVIFPSLSESFGLGLVEAIEFNCIIIGANLPYTFEVCTPSLSFNPYDIESIEESFHKAMNSDYNNTIPKVSNKIKDILKILNND